jgi:hypothetical protein
MRIKPILITLGLLGTSSVALADHQPQRGYTHREITYRDLRPRPTSWIPLTARFDLDRRLVADLSTRHRFEQLRLQNQTGRTSVKSVIVVFQNGERQRVPVNRVLRGNHSMVDIDLNGQGRRIDRVIVVGDSGRRGSLQLFAM